MEKEWTTEEQKVKIKEMSEYIIRYLCDQGEKEGVTPTMTILTLIALLTSLVDSLYIDHFDKASIREAIIDEMRSQWEKEDRKCLE